jgi:hypothetical protein
MTKEKFLLWVEVCAKATDLSLFLFSHRNRCDVVRGAALYKKKEKAYANLVRWCNGRPELTASNTSASTWSG